MSFFLKDALAQSQVRIYIKPESAIVKLDSVEVQNGETHFVSEGEHLIQAWAETYQLKDTIIYIAGSLYNTCVFDLQPSEKYTKYIKEKKELQKLKLNKRQLPLIAISVGSLAVCSFSNNRFWKPAKDANERAKIYYENYTSTLNYEWILEAEQNYVEAEALYTEMKRKHVLTTSSALVIGSGLCFWILKSTKKNNDFTEPVYDEPNLLTLGDFNFQKNNFGGLTFNLTFNL